MDTLFDAAPYTVAAADLAPGERLSGDRRRTLRQAAAIARGEHPLSLAVAGVRMHPDADRTAAKDNANGRPLRCGTCVFREHRPGGNRAWPKCTVGMPKHPNGQPAFLDGPRVSRGAGTDVRSWWPACTDYQAVARG